MAITPRKSGNRTRYKAEVAYKTYRASKTFDTRKEAKAWEAAQLIELKSASDGSKKPTGGKTVTTLLDKFETEHVAKGRSAEAEGFHLLAVRRGLGDVALADLKDSHIEAFIKARLKTVKPSTVRRNLGPLYTALRLAQSDWKWAVRVPEVPLPEKAPARTRRFEGNEEERMYEALNQNMKDYMILAVETTMRRGELMRVCPAHLRLDGNMLHIQFTKNAIPRTIALSQVAKEVIEKRCKGKLKDERLFPNKVEWPTRIWVRTRNKLGIKNLRLHDIRREAASRLIESGWSIPNTAEMTGHKSWEQLQGYVSIRPTHLVEQMQKTDALRAASLLEKNAAREAMRKEVIAELMRQAMKGDRTTRKAMQELLQSTDS